MTFLVFGLLYKIFVVFMAGGKYKRCAYPKGWYNHYRSRRTRLTRKKGPLNQPVLQEHSEDSVSGAGDGDVDNNQPGTSASCQLGVSIT